MNSRMNCLTASDYYAVCCLNECDALMDRLETKIASPLASPAQIADVVSKMQSDTVDAPRNLSVSLLNRLDEIAQTHAGKVPLHGRLFTQWMHHVYPRECSFPHMSGAVQPMYPLEFAMAMGHKYLEVTKEVMQMHAARSEVQSDEPIELPWSHVEELVAEHTDSRPFQFQATMHAVVAVVALASFAMPIARAVKAVFSRTEAKSNTHWV